MDNKEKEAILLPASEVVRDVILSTEGKIFKVPAEHVEKIAAFMKDSANGITVIEV